MKIKSPEDLKSLKDKGLKTLYPDTVRVGIGMATCGIASGARAVADSAAEFLKDYSGKIDIVEVGCLGLCQAEPLVDVYRTGMGRIVYGNVDTEIIVKILEAVRQSKEYTDNAIFKMSGEEILLDDRVRQLGNGSYPDVPEYKEQGFFSKQKKLALRNCGFIDLWHIEEYIARGGYSALAKALSGIDRKKIIDNVIDSGLRGRGGGGFRTGWKWEACYDEDTPVKYVICNADEGDPGAYMDRSIMEGDPHSVIEGMAIGAYAIGANEGYVYIRTEYPLAVAKLEHAIKEARKVGLLGKNIMGSGFDFDVLIARGSGAFVCGESSALIASIEGKPGEPRAKHVHMSESGLWGKPTTLNNVETWANVPVIIARGADWFASIGTEKSTGTKVFSLVGNVNTTGLVEVPMGMSLRKIVYDIGGGVSKGRQLKAVQTGGPSGGCIPAEEMELAVDFDTLDQAGSMMGSGGMIVMDDHTCMVDVARYFIEFLVEESCGKCTSCREGLKQMDIVLNRICDGKGKDDDLGLLEDLCDVIENASLCGLGTSAPNPVRSTMNFFRDEYEAHVFKKSCPAGVCRELITYDIDREKCIGCGACLRVCPTDAICGEKKQPHSIEQEKCVKCGSCAEACKFEAVIIR